jgi:hypothetical protein
MDKFDETIKNARETHEPSEHFVEDTMQHVMNQQPPEHTKSRGFRLWVPIAAGAVIVIALVFVLLPSGKSKAPGSSGATNVATTGGTPTISSASGALPSGTSNADLASDLSSVQSSMNQEGTDQNSANSALNDQSQEITVPTN